MNKKKTISVTITVAILILALLLLGPVVTIRKDNEWTCAYTGSRKGNTTWIGCITTVEWYTRSPIEQWLNKNNRPIEHDWVRTVGTEYGLFGGRGFSHPRAPAIYHFLPQLQQQFVRTASTEEIEDFLRLLREGSLGDARKAVDALSDKMINEM